MAKDVLTLRVDQATRDKWAKAASDAGMKLGEWIRQSCDEAIKRESDRENLRQLMSRAPAWAVERAEDARSLHREGKTTRMGHAQNCRCLACRPPK